MKTFAFVLAVLASGTAMAQDSGTAAACAPQLSPLQARLYQKAVDGTGALRDFLYIRRGILQLDVTQTAEWAASVSQDRSACMKKVAEAQPPAPQVTL
jgi:hypothetical protein